MCSESKKRAWSARSPRGGDRRDDPLITAYAALARQERAAALRALAGQFAHQVRNRLAATHAACDNLRTELADPDHRQRLQMALTEVDKLLDLVSSTVHALAENPEIPESVNVLDETQEVVQIFVGSHPDSPPVELLGDPVRALLPRTGMRVAIYSLLDHLVRVAVPASASITVLHTGNRLKIRFTARSTRTSEHPVAEDQWPMQHSLGAGLVGLLVAERFARDIGGRLARSMTGTGSLVLTLDVPCQPDA